MRNIFTYPNNAGTSYIDPLYVGDDTVGFQKRIKDLKDGNYKAWDGTAPTDTVSDLMSNISKFNNYYNTVGDNNITIDDIYTYPLLTGNVTDVSQDVTAFLQSNTFAEPIIITTTAAHGLVDGDNLQLSNLNGNLAYLNGDTVYTKVVNSTSIKLTLDAGLTQELGLRLVREADITNINAGGDATFTSVGYTLLNGSEVGVSQINTPELALLFAEQASYFVETINLDTFYLCSDVALTNRVGLALANVNIVSTSVVDTSEEYLKVDLLTNTNGSGGKINIYNAQYGTAEVTSATGIDKWIKKVGTSTVYDIYDDQLLTNRTLSVGGSSTLTYDTTGSVFETEKVYLDQNGVNWKFITTNGSLGTNPKPIIIRRAEVPQIIRDHSLYNIGDFVWRYYDSNNTNTQNEVYHLQYESNNVYGVYQDSAFNFPMVSDTTIRGPRISGANRMAIGDGYTGSLGINKMTMTDTPLLTDGPNPIRITNQFTISDEGFNEQAIKGIISGSFVNTYPDVWYPQGAFHESAYSDLLPMGGDCEMRPTGDTFQNHKLYKYWKYEPIAAEWVDLSQLIEDRLVDTTVSSGQVFAISTSARPDLGQFWVGQADGYAIWNNGPLEQGPKFCKINGADTEQWYVYELIDYSAGGWAFSYNIYKLEDYMAGNYIKVRYPEIPYESTIYSYRQLLSGNPYQPGDSSYRSYPEYFVDDFINRANNPGTIFANQPTFVLLPDNDTIPYGDNWLPSTNISTLDVGTVSVMGAVLTDATDGLVKEVTGPIPDGTTTVPVELPSATTGTLYNDDPPNWALTDIELVIPANNNYTYQNSSNVTTPGAEVGPTYMDTSGTTFIHPGSPDITLTTDGNGRLTGATLNSNQDGYLTPNEIVFGVEALPDQYVPPAPNTAADEDIFDTADEWTTNGYNGAKEFGRNVIPATAEITYVTPSTVNNSQGGTKYVRSSGFTRWKLTATYINLSKEKFQILQADAQAARGQATPFFLMTGQWGGWDDNGKVLNFANIKSTTAPRLIEPYVAGETLMKFGGFESNESEVFKKGQIIRSNSVNGGVTTVLNTVDANVYGEAEVRIAFGQKNAKSNGAIVYTDNWHFVATLDSDDFTYSVDTFGLYNVTIGFELGEFS